MGDKKNQNNLITITGIYQLDLIVYDALIFFSNVVIYGYYGYLLALSLFFFFINYRVFVKKC